MGSLPRAHNSTYSVDVHNYVYYVEHNYVYYYFIIHNHVYYVTEVCVGQ